jgi:acyl-CoA thioester hydrolase
MTRIEIEILEKSLYQYTFTIKETDINYAKHMGNERILVFANIIRSEFYKHLNLIEGDWDEGHGTIVANHTIKYVSEGFLNDEITCNVGVANITTCSYDLIFHFLKKNNKTLALVRTGSVYFDYHEKRIREIPDSFKKAFM